MHYPGDTYRALNDAKRVTKVAAWLKNAEINLGPVQLPDGSEIERVIEPLVPRKQVTAYNPRYAPCAFQPSQACACQGADVCPPLEQASQRHSDVWAG